MEPFVPQIYSIGSRSRFWPYGTPYVRTPIPGAGFKGRRMYYGTQPMDLGGLGQTPPMKPSPAVMHSATARMIRDPRQRFILACRGGPPVSVRGYRNAVARARALAHQRGSECHVTLPSLLRRNVPLPLTVVNPSGQVMVDDVSLGGLGQDVDPARAATVIANLLIDPERELRVRGDALAAALDRHVATPLVESMGRQMQPYFWKYVFPPLLILYAISSVAAIKAWQAEARLARGA
ncbi:MAG TPA: hypothetical protein VIY27_06725 [Myxococcota bacterium]